MLPDSSVIVLLSDHINLSGKTHFDEMKYFHFNENAQIFAMGWLYKNTNILPPQ